MTYSLLRFGHLVGLMIMGAGLIGMWVLDFRSRNVRDLALFADEEEAVRFGADQAGALSRSAESIGKHVATQLLDDLKSGATVDRYAADQIIPFAALASGESRFIIPTVTEHVLTSAWLAETFLDTHVRLEGQRLVIHGIGFWPNHARATN